jgi:hypothetical protein
MALPTVHPRHPIRAERGMSQYWDPSYTFTCDLCGITLRAGYKPEGWTEIGRQLVVHGGAVHFHACVKHQPKELEEVLEKRFQK